MDFGLSEQNAGYGGEEPQYEGHYDSKEGNYDSVGNIDDSSGLKHDSSPSAGKLFVGGIAWETSEDSFRGYFEKYGEISDYVIMMDKITGRPRGFGFITFSDPEVAERVLQEEHVIDGRGVEVKRTVPREDMQGRGVSKTKKIFVGGLPSSTNEDGLREYFSSYGNTVECQIMLDHNTGRSRGFGFVTFENEDAVDKILSDGRMHELDGKQVEIKRAEPKRSGFDYSADSRFRRGAGSSRSYGNFSGGFEGLGGNYGGKMGRGYGGYDSYNGYGSYGNFPGNYTGGSAGFYAGYGGYGYGYGFGGMYSGGNFGGGGGSFGEGGAPSYVGGRAFRGLENVYDDGNNLGNGTRFPPTRGYGTSPGGYPVGKGYKNVMGDRFHPYRK